MMQLMTAPHATPDRHTLGDQRLETVADRTPVKQGNSMNRASLDERDTPQERLVERHTVGPTGSEACGTPALAATAKMMQRGSMQDRTGRAEGECGQVRKIGQVFQRSCERTRTIGLQIETR